MDLLSAYVIDLKKLELGEHCFDYAMEDDFFAALAHREMDERGSLEVQAGKVQAHVSITAHTTGYEVCYEVRGSIQIPCDRCLEPMDQPVKGKDHISLPATDEEVDLAWLLYEQVALSIPVMHTHPDGQCNPEMLQKLQEHSAAQDNGGNTIGDLLKLNLKK